MKQSTTEEFIIKAKVVQADYVPDDWYDYSQVNYKSAKEKVKIRCKEHGWFWQTPTGHLSGRGCLECGKDRSSRNQQHTTEQFIIHATKKYGDRFDYSGVDYKGYFVKVEIRCKEHGWFWQPPSEHLNGDNGCPKCGYKARALTKTSNTETFLGKAIELYGGLFDYSRVDYRDSRFKVEIGCKEHGWFWETPSNHLHGSRLHCPICGYYARIESRLVTENEFLERAYDCHGDWYDYSQADYTGLINKIKIGCPIHGWFYQQARHHIANHGCPKCGWDKSGKLYTDNPTILYYIKFIDFDGTLYWKVGITSRSIGERFRMVKEGHMEVLWEKEYSTGETAWNLEQLLLNKFSKYRAFNKDVEVLKGGWTELFVKDVLSPILSRV